MRTWTSCNNCGTVNNLKAFNEDRMEWLLKPPEGPFVYPPLPPEYYCYNCNEEM